VGRLPSVTRTVGGGARELDLIGALDVALSESDEPNARRNTEKRRQFGE
jgi:hypothetical protein